MKKILIVGKRGFIGNNLSKYLKKFYKVKHKSFRDTIKIKFKINNFDYVINTSINQNYVKKKYNQKKSEMSKLRLQLMDHKKTSSESKLILSIDRLDYTKGVINRIKAFEIFLTIKAEFRPLFLTDITSPSNA